MVTSAKLKWRSDFDKQVILQNFDRRGWTKANTEGNEEWNIFWAGVWTIKSIFNPQTGHRLADNQLLNHFPNHYELTRKDLMVKNLRRFKKECRSSNHPLAEKDEFGNELFLDAIPTTYILPLDYPIFEEDFRKNPTTVWIAKPSGGAQGKGILIVSQLNQMKKWANYSKQRFQQPMSISDNYIISKYVDNPLLIGGKKFDLRMYVLITCFKPLKAWLGGAGFARFCTEKYVVGEFDNKTKHITNVHFQQQSDKYNQIHGGKWSLTNLKLYLEMTQGKEKTDKCFDEINNLVYVSLKSVQNIIINDKHCFEMYGYDVLIDSNLKPWLIEVNASPSLTTTTESDRVMKMTLMQDTFSIVVPPEWNDDNCKYGANMSKEKQQVGCYTLLIDEAEQDEKNKKGIKDKRNNRINFWK